MSTVSLAEFKKLDLCVAKVLEVNEHPNADRLWLMSVDVGDGKSKQIVAGVKGAYSKEALMGRSVIIVGNMEPAQIRGVESQAMLLAAKHGGELTLLQLDKELPPGSPVS